MPKITVGTKLLITEGAHWTYAEPSGRECARPVNTGETMTYIGEAGKPYILLGEDGNKYYWSAAIDDILNDGADVITEDYEENDI